jgi:hypothetical protein
MRFVRINDLTQARAALAAGQRPGGPAVTLATAPGLAHFAGVGYWRAVEAALGRSIVIDCGEDAGLAMAALRAGCRDLLFTGDAALAARLADMAGQLGATLRRHLDGEVLTPLPEASSFSPDTGGTC